MAKATATVSTIFNDTKNLMPGRFEELVTQRTGGFTTSGFYQEDPIELACLLWDAQWEAFHYTPMGQGIIPFKAKLAGYVGVISIESLPNDAVLVCDDRNEKGVVSLSICADACDVPIADETWIITDSNRGDWVLLDFHAGPPTTLSYVRMDDVPVRITKQEALALGFNNAKIVS